MITIVALVSIIKLLFYFVVAIHFAPPARFSAAREDMFSRSAKAAAAQNKSFWRSAEHLRFDPRRRLKGLLHRNRPDDRADIRTGRMHAGCGLTAAIVANQLISALSG
jgi:hypothetical protein